MTSIYPVTIPKWGIEMQEGTISAWHFEVGQAVEKGQDLIDIESDKIVNTMEVPVDGILLRIVAGPEDTLKVGQLLGVIADEGTPQSEIDAFIENFVPADASFGIGEGSDEAPSVVSESVTEDAVVPAEVKISPVARRLAEKLGVNVSRVNGTGRNGRISTDDVEAAAAGRNDPGGQAAGPSPAPLNSRALAAARRMVESKQTIPHFYLQRDLDMRSALAAKQREAVPLTALLLQALACAMQSQADINRHFVNDALLAQNDISINVAIDTPEGLVAPLMRNLAGASAGDISTGLKELATKARDRTLSSPELAAGGLTLSNLGMFGISGFSAIITPPQIAILAVGAIRPLQLDMGGDTVPAMSATLSCDHRALDGASGARFLAALQDALDAL